VLDLSGMAKLEPVRIALLIRLVEIAEEHGSRLELHGASRELIADLEQAAASLLGNEGRQEAQESLIERIGELALMAEQSWAGWGRFTLDGLRAIVLDPLFGKPWKGATIVEQMDLIGVRATTIVIFISLLVGMVLALNGAQELSRFGASMFIANLVAVSMVREMGPLITAVLVAGRSGSAIAAELGTMVVAEEIDALKTMGLPPVRYLVAPRVIAMVAMVPCLTVVSDLCGIFAGYVVGAIGLRIGSQAYLIQTSQAIRLSDLNLGLIKSAVFAFLIGVISCREGLEVTGGAEGVGKAATGAVVLSVVASLTADAVFTYLFYVFGS